MDFYKKLSYYYDRLFPLNKVELNFIINELGLKKSEKILELGCGTGEFSLALLSSGLDVIGIDLDNDMIENAKQKNKNYVDNFYQLNMLCIQDKFKQQNFDGIICLGNTLVHLDGVEKITSTLLNIYNLLCNRGKIIIQIVNYDRILNKNITSLPTIELETVKFDRIYTPGSKITFKTVLYDKTKCESYENETELYPLKQKELNEILIQCGFKNIMWYGNFNGESYQPDSYASIAVAEKILCN